MDSPEILEKRAKFQAALREVGFSLDMKDVSKDGGMRKEKETQEEKEKKDGFERSV